MILSPENNETPTQEQVTISLHEDTEVVNKEKAYKPLSLWICVFEDPIVYCSPQYHVTKMIKILNTKFVEQLEQVNGKRDAVLPFDN